MQSVLFLAVFLVSACLFLLFDWWRRPQQYTFSTFVLYWMILLSAGLFACAFWNGWITEVGPALTTLLVVAVPLSFFVLYVLAAVFLFHWKNRETLAAHRLAAQGKYEEAIARLRELMEERGPDLNAAVNISCYYFDLGRYEEALREAEWAEGQFGEQPPILFNKCSALVKLDRAEEALFLVQSALVGRPDDVLLTGRYALVLAEVGRFDEAREQLARAEELYKKRKVVVDGVNYREILDKVREEVRKRVEEAKA